MLPEGEIDDTKVLAALLGISEMVAGLTDLEEVLGVIVRITPQLVGAERCAVFLYDPQREEFRTAQVFGPDRERNAIIQRLVIREAEVRKIAHRILEQKLPALVRDTTLPPAMVEALGHRTVLVVPLVCRERTLGIMTLDHGAGPRLFTSKEINVAMGVAQHAAIAIDNFARQADAERAREKARVTGELLADGMITLAPDLRVLSLDPSAEDLLLWPTAEVAGKGLGEAFAITDRDGVRLPDLPGVGARALRPGALREAHVISFRRRDGERILCEVRTADVRDELGEVLEVVCALRRATSEGGETGPVIANPVARRILNAGAVD